MSEVIAARPGSPAEIKGRMQSVRNILHPVLICIFLILPWLRVNGGPVFLFNLIDRHFIVFGVSFFSHEAPLFFYFIILILLSLFILTAIFGRLWCGWACPQTVFLHGVINKIETMLLGSFTRRTLYYREHPGPTFRKLALHLIYLLVSWVISHSVAAYFMGAERLTLYVVDEPFSHRSTFLLLMIITSVLYLNFTYFRERLCFFVCPYGRFQNALVDANSITVFYDKVRGEPRGKLNAINDGGDCVDCKKCVHVCPTNIDIRNGFQLECISCARCIDACDDVMRKLQRPTGLIRYQTGNQKPINYKRFRLALYGVLFIVFFSAFTLSLAFRHQLDIVITRQPGQPFTVREFEQENKATKIFQNRFQIHLKNQGNHSLRVKVRLSEKSIVSGFQVITPAADFELKGDQDIKLPVFIEIEDSRFDEKQSEIEFVVHSDDAIVTRKLKFVRSN